MISHSLKTLQVAAYALGSLLCGLQFQQISYAQSLSQQLVLRFAEYPSTSSNVVVLGDLVEVQSGNSESLQQLMDIPLGPAPRVGQGQFWHSKDVLQHLRLRGVDVQRLRWAGNSKATLTRNNAPSSDQKRSMLPAFATDRIAQQALRFVEDAIASYLDRRLGEETDWRIAAEFPEQYIDLVRSRRSIVSIGGGQAPWEGLQEFILQVREGDRLINITVKASVQLPPMVFSAKTAVRKEQIIKTQQLSLVPLPQGANVNDYFTSIDDLVGQQVKRSISTGLAIKREYVGRPIIVQRNDLVQVESVSGGIVVSTSGRSKGAGAEGDLIEIETLDRTRLYATIVGQGRVRIAAVSARTR